MALGNKMGRTMAVPTPFGCISCRLPRPDYPPAVITFLFCVMVVTIMVDLVGNFMVVLAVLRNKKLRNSGKPHFALPTLLAIRSPSGVSSGARNRGSVDRPSH